MSWVIKAVNQPQWTYLTVQSTAENAQKIELKHVCPLKGFIRLRPGDFEGHKIQIMFRIIKLFSFGCLS